MPVVTGSSVPLHGYARAHTWPRGSAAHITSTRAARASIPSDSDDDRQVHVASHGGSRDLLPSLEDDEIDADPEKHFLSPIHMYEYEDWAEEDSDDETTEVEWDAGITDFALFDDDRRHAQEAGRSLPNRWNDLISNQASALQRSEQRSQRRAGPSFQRQPSPRQSEEIPDLTPDNSPDLRDDLDDTESERPRLRGRSRTTSDMPPQIIVTPPGWEDRRRSSRMLYTAADSDEDDEADAEELFFDLHTTAPGYPSDHSRRTRLQRPGLRQSRTLSGQAHVWKWPSAYITPVSEDSDGEFLAERDDEAAS